jgi:hypothetical protein
VELGGLFAVAAVGVGVRGVGAAGQPHDLLDQRTLLQRGEPVPHRS